MKNSPITLALVKGSWNEQKGRFKARFSTLADANLHYKQRKSRTPLHTQEEKIHKTKEDLTAIDFRTISTF
jgi:hypothetical protein